MNRVPTSTIKVSVFAAITFVVIGLLGTIIDNTSFQATRSYFALFTDATSVEGGETVRLAGVPVGTVRGARIVDAGDQRLAQVEFTVDNSVPVFQSATLRLRYENIVGRRYLAIDERAGAGALMTPGGTFLTSQTVPALDLTALFNGFQPLFQALDPNQVNQLSYEIIQTLQGEGGTLARLMSHTAHLTATIGDKDAVIGQVVDNLNAILNTVKQRDGRLTQLIDALRELMRGLANDKDTIAGSVPSTASLFDTTSDLLARARSPLRDDIGGLRSLASQVAATNNVLDDKLRRLPGKLRTGSRLASYGSWFNFYLCRLDARVSLQDDVINLSTPVDVSANERDTVCGMGGPR